MGGLSTLIHLQPLTLISSSTVFLNIIKPYLASASYLNLLTASLFESLTEIRMPFLPMKSKAVGIPPHVVCEAEIV